MMSWLGAAILSAATLGLINIIDSHLLSKRMPSLGSYLVPVGIANLIGGLVIFLLYPPPANLSSGQISVALASGISRTIAIIIILRALQNNEVSKIVPVTNIYPIFVAIFAIPILGEILRGIQWIAILITTAGAMLIFSNIDRGLPKARPGKTFPLLIIASLLIAVANIAGKFALDYISPWNLYTITTFCMAGTFFLLFLRFKIFRELGHLKRPVVTMSLLAGNETLVLLSMVLFFWAMDRGFVSLVSAIASTMPAFVFIYVIIISRVSPILMEWHMKRETIVLRSISIAMIVGGIALIYLY